MKNLRHYFVGRTLRSPFIAFVAVWSLTGCGQHGSTQPYCQIASVWDGTQCIVFANFSTERMATPFVENGRALALEVVVFRPLATGPYPTVVFHHGSTGNGGSDASLFTETIWSGTVAKEFTDRGYMVLFPQRRGRGKSDGLYDEGLEPDRSRYSCRQDLALQGLEHALEDAEVITQQVLLRTDIIPSRLLVGGISRGGMLALVHAARRPGVYQGVINFVGGWVGESCSDSLAINRGSFVSAGVFDRPSLWLYGENDSFYSVDFSQANFNAFVAAGGRGSFHVYLRSTLGANGHGIANEPLLWHDDLWAYVKGVIE